MGEITRMRPRRPSRKQERAVEIERQRARLVELREYRAAIQQLLGALLNPANVSLRAAIPEFQRAAEALDWMNNRLAYETITAAAELGEQIATGS